ncbi:hypothetical protein FLONG3_11354 [Fusarium longipes]|uniref:Uncharacterized protein n=1 Tax=Fusarium longipes TaxID=694270 RepID=A0A395RFR5_9HYPO|nr:hypothetical protein FLONG3_11354 [Fusarium longipes]
MPTAQGFIKGCYMDFTSTFIIDDIQYHFSGRLSPPVPEFECPEATLKYESLEALTDERLFDGKIGSSDVNLEVKPGVRITGRLDLPISPAHRVSGEAEWSSN